ncbi:wd40 domain-containing protein [Rutstroemia sp. NJR-2017a BVV2]|nr:wd40 domain-containing protein [Rutstroemia sp. NJR-2017a BVV2]
MSPNGAHVATILPSRLIIRETRSLEVARAITLPPELTTSTVTFVWSPSSNRVLVASADTIRVFSPVDHRFSATITSPTSGTTKTTFICFGGSDDEVCVFTEFGLKLTVFNLATSRAAEIPSPKLFTPATAAKGISHRPRSGNLALLTRSAGKDVISIHKPGSLEVIRSWTPETIDAQGLAWSPDGRWIAVWESAAQGHKVLIYTADGHLYKLWGGSAHIIEEDKDSDLGAGVKTIEWSQTGKHIAIGDHGQRIVLLAAPAFAESMVLSHSSSIRPSDTLHVWQEQILPGQNGGFTREFIAATQLVLPPTSTAPATAESRAGTNALSFDVSGTLLATKVEDMPTTVWIWDVGNRSLRAVLILHAPIARIAWHPSITELLMIRCEGEENKGRAQLWDPSWEMPKIINFGTQVPEGKIIGKSIVRWLNIDHIFPSLFFSDSQDYILASLSRPEDTASLPWSDAEAGSMDINDQPEESPLNLVEPTEKRNFRRVKVDLLPDDGDSYMNMSEGSDQELDDTFHFLKSEEP